MLRSAKRTKEILESILRKTGTFLRILKIDENYVQ
jgi:hypothetical protein